ncbi:hypothetical protein [Mycolicibacterium diernhoferi]|uniref:Antitoxin n=1 Tax=Mycolicibacterium diernhoferi TaxID=1801 RepID=A0A1Q4HC78_9MYCO|nr:hypothetical protein [Mycolicibacterium diernhoferi]OJZ65128.1 hypothetical protein BRW64_14960 [Mycolicibacterium diernhoferi]OPE47799.1 hypothetical protein BV510_24495 [Mycolicibacterium diernhoferi]PEG55055.1 hypothetical protein CRI78_07545 [Mycolicibacterium diernhoferi]QYL23661.1 hypothetical protein K0O62_04910 [Mycolicibacterium diernhoferi]
MTVIGIGQLRSYTRAYVERARSGETFQVLRRGRPVARLQAVQDGVGVPVPLADLRTRPAQVFDRIAAGATVLVTYRGHNVATLQPID